MSDPKKKSGKLYTKLARSIGIIIVLCLLGVFVEQFTGFFTAMQSYFVDHTYKRLSLANGITSLGPIVPKACDTLIHTSLGQDVLLSCQSDSIMSGTIKSKQCGTGGVHKTVASSKQHSSDITGENDTVIHNETIDTLPVSSPHQNSGPCADPTPPWIYPDPSGGLHRLAVRVGLYSDKPCVIEWKFSVDSLWQNYTATPISISHTATLVFRGRDSCGRAMEQREEYYEIAAQTIQKCPDGMEYIAVGATIFCIDKYEWPNRAGHKPRGLVSVYGAMDSCASAGKRLCTQDEWSIACSGPYGYKYPYGDHFEPRACVTHDTTVRPSGSRPECRGFFEVFDMSGNLLEWTNTRSKKNNQFYNVLGGFWDSDVHSGCFDERYSYYPQNRHNPVGFRCCKNVPPASRTGGK